MAGLYERARKRYEKKYRKQQKSKPTKTKPKGKGKKGNKLPKDVIDVRKLRGAKRAMRQAEPQVTSLIEAVRKTRRQLKAVASSANKMAGQLSGYRSVYVTVICTLVGFVTVAAITGDAFRNQASFGWTLIAGAVIGAVGYSITEAVDK